MDHYNRYDKNENILNVGDWVLYPWWNGNKYIYHVGSIKGFEEGEPGITYVASKYAVSRTCNLIKIPNNSQERSNFLFLFMLESGEPTLDIR